VVYTTFHFPETNANVVTTENSDWATNCPEYKVTAVEVVFVNQKDAWKKRAEEERSLPRQGHKERAQEKTSA
jgi:formate dehydrogenase major subunit